MIDHSTHTYAVSAGHGSEDAHDDNDDAEGRGKKSFEESSWTAKRIRTEAFHELDVGGRRAVAQHVRFGAVDVLRDSSIDAE